MVRGVADQVLEKTKISLEKRITVARPRTEVSDKNPQHTRERLRNDDRPRLGHKTIFFTGCQTPEV
jgi:hypothetical protein